MSIRKGQVVLTTLVTPSTDITFPIVGVNDIGGGRHIVANLNERNTIPESHRKAGMIVYVQSEDKDYMLKAEGLTGTLTDASFEDYLGVEDITYVDSDTNGNGAATLLERLANIDTAIESAAELQTIEQTKYDYDTEDPQYPTGTERLSRANNLKTELDTIFTFIEDMNLTNKILVETITDDQSGEETPYYLDQKLIDLTNAINEALANTHTLPIVNKFEIATDVFESGATVDTITVNWQFNKTMTSAVLKANGSTIADLKESGADTVPVVGTKVVTGLTISSATTITIEVGDDQSETTTATADISFANKFVYGVVDSDTEINSVDDAALSALTKTGLLNAPYGKYIKFECGNSSKRIVVAFPASWNIQDYQLNFLNGFSNGWLTSNVDYTNESNGVVNYKVYMFEEPLENTILVSVAETF